MSLVVDVNRISTKRESDSPCRYMREVDNEQASRLNELSRGESNTVSRFIIGKVRGSIHRQCHGRVREGSELEFGRFLRFDVTAEVEEGLVLRRMNKLAKRSAGGEGRT